jgi:gas vesicle protein
VYDETSSNRAFDFILGVALGAAVGAGVALLTAPQKGSRTRRKIARAAGDARHSAQDQIEELTDNLKGGVDKAVKVARSRVGR